jgi:hypothetical protein
MLCTDLQCDVQGQCDGIFIEEYRVDDFDDGPTTCVSLCDRLEECKWFT